MLLELLLLGMLLAALLAYYLERTRREREAGVVLPFSGGYVLRMLYQTLQSYDRGRWLKTE